MRLFLGFLLQVMLSVCLVGVVLPAYAANSVRGSLDVIYLNSVDLKCIDQQAAWLMQQPDSWKAALERALHDCINEKSSLAVRFEILRLRIKSGLLSSVLLAQALSTVRLRYALAYLFLYDYCPDHAVTRCLVPGNFTAEFSSHETD